MESLAQEQKNMKRQKNLDKSIREMKNEMSSATPRSFDALLDRLYRHRRIDKKTMKRLRGGPDKQNWNDGNQFFISDKEGRKFTPMGKQVNRNARGTTRKKLHHRTKKRKTHTKIDTLKYYFSPKNVCRLNTNSEMVKIYSGSEKDQHILSKTAEPIGVIIFKFTDFPNACGDFKEGDKVRTLENIILLNKSEGSCSYVINYFMKKNQRHFDKGSDYNTKLQSNQGKFNKYNKVNVKTNENNIRVLKLRK